MSSDGQRTARRPAVAELAYGFQESVVDVLTTKTLRAAEEIGAQDDRRRRGSGRELGPPRAGSSAGAESRGIRVVVPRPGLCTDNASMIGAAASGGRRAGERAGRDLAAKPSLKLAVRHR